MTRLERHSRLLLHVYPKQYRAERAEEMLGTLLEATPEERNWPRARDARALLAGGLRARAALNRRLPLRANVRTAVFVGLAAFLGFSAVARLSNLYANAGVIPGGWTRLPSSVGWTPILGPLLTLVVVLVAWFSRRRIAVLAAALPAAAAFLIPLTASCSVRLAGHCYGYAQFGQPVRGIGFYESVIQLSCMTCLVTLAGSGEPRRSGWLVPLGLVLLSPALLELGGGVAEVTAVLVLAVAAVSIAWIVVDARPMIAVCVFVLADWLGGGGNLLTLISSPAVTVVLLPGLGAALALAIWRLRYQSARTPRLRA